MPEKLLCVLIYVCELLIRRNDTRIKLRIPLHSSSHQLLKPVKQPQMFWLVTHCKKATPKDFCLFFVFLLLSI